MKLTLPWLKEHLETTASLEVICEKLTALGLEVEGVTDPAADLAAFTVAYVREARQHPNADRLRLCTVETSQGVVEVVCGAPNARTGMKGVFASIGAVIPASGEALKKAAIRGVTSNGMLCSARELRLGEDHEGIIELPEEAEVGAPAAQALGLEGAVIEIKLTPDRADCFGVNGIARDLAAAGLGRLHVRDFSAVPSEGPVGPSIRLDFPAGEERACPLFLGRIIRGVRNGESPVWLRNRLKAIGLRPISALVDITNYVTFDLCRPLHVFDAAKLQGDLTLRFAREGEELVALDGKTYRLDPEMTVIADPSGAVSLGGIMGGEGTGVTGATTDVLLEVALFDPVRTAATGRKLGIESDARARFERGLDPALVHSATEHATRLIMQICGGTAGPIVTAGHPPAGPEPMRFRRSALPRLAGISLEAHEVESLLPHLGFLIEGGPELYSVTPPTWRHDVTTEACIVEELARLVGFDRIPPVSLERQAPAAYGVLTAEQRRRGAIRRAVASQGLAEAVTYSFIPSEQARLFGSDTPILMRNPLSADLSAMRPSLLPNLVAAAKRNHDRKQAYGGLFEIGPRYTGSAPGQQATGLAGLRFGMAGPRSWAERERPVDALDAKADALAALVTAGFRPEQVQAATDGLPAWYHPGRAGQIVQGNRPLATFGELHPDVLAAYDITFPVVGFEADLEALAVKPRATKARPPLEPLPFPPVDRDFAFLVDAAVPAAKLTDAVRGVERKLVREVRLFDLYEGKGVPEGKRSLAVAVRLQAGDHTLTEAEIEHVAKRIVAAVEKDTGASLRT
jgi:phenylalanyl-tRNA synthetase beta chain